MKVCFISNLYPPEVMGGAELYVERLVKKFAENKDNQIIIITANQKFSLKNIVEQKENIKIYRIWPLNFYSLTTKRKYPLLLKVLWHLIDLWNPFSYFTIKKILEKERSALIHTHNLAGLSFSVFSAIKSLGLRLIHTLHDYYLICPYANLVCPFTDWKFRKFPPFFCRWYRKITRVILKNKVDIILTPSKFVMDVHLKNGFFTNSRQFILPLGIENNMIKYHDRDKRSDESFNILCVGQLAPHKGVEILIKAFTLIRNYQLPITNYQLTIIGDGSEKQKLEKLASTESQNDFESRKTSELRRSQKNITFLGRLSHQETQKKYQEADVVVIPSLAPETFSLVMFEAMAAGKPVIASKIGALAEYIKDGETGFLFEAGNVNQLKEILEKVINQPDLIKKTGQNAQQFAQEFTFQKHWEKLVEIYKN